MIIAKKATRSYVQLIAFGLNYSFKKLGLYGKRLRLNLHYHKSLTLNLTPYPILMKVYKRRISFYGDIKLLHTVIEFICSLKDKQMYTGKALRMRHSRYRVKKMPRDLKDKK